MGEPALYPILQRFQSDLAAIQGDAGVTYWYSPVAVHIVRTWNDPRLWDGSLGGPIYAIRRTDRHHNEETTGDNANAGFVAAAVDVHVLVSQPFAPASVSDAPDETLVVERMLRDVLRKLFLDSQLGGLATNVALDDGGADDTIIEDPEHGWAAGQIAFRVGYSWPASAP